MPRRIGLILGLVVALLAVVQIALPLLAAHHAEGKLEERGGSADVSVHAFPAFRLLFEEGRSLEITGHGLKLDPAKDKDNLSHLDGFGTVDVRLKDVRAGPLAISSFSLQRPKSRTDYEIHMQAMTTPREVARFLGTQAGGAFGGLLGDFAGGSLPDAGNSEVPLDIDAAVRSRNGEAEVGDVTGSVAGIPAGPLAKLAVDAVVAAL